MASTSKGLRPPLRLRAFPVALAVASTLLFHSATAQTLPADEKRALATQITEISLQSVDLRQLAAAALDQATRGVANKSEEFKRAIAAIIPILEEEIGVMMKDVVRLSARFYEENFDTAELRQLKDFVASPVGRKQAKLGAEFMARFTVTMQKAFEQRGPAIQARIKEELTKRGIQL